VFGTIAAESQRLINETYSAFVQGFMPTLSRPEVDVLDGLTTSIVVDQERMGGNARSTVGTVTDANGLLRILFSRLGQPHIGSPNAFSFNVPSVKASGAITVERGAGKTQTKKATFTRLGGMCPRCEGMGNVTDFDLSELLHRRQLAGGYRCQLDRPAEGGVEHAGRELSGERVLLTRVEATGHRHRPDTDLGAMAEARGGARHVMARRTERPERTVPGEGTERDDHAEIAQKLQLLDKIRQAGVPLLRRRAVGGRGAPNHRGDVRADQAKTVIAMHGHRLVRQPRSMQRGEEEVARPVAGEDPSGPVAAVGRRRQPDDEDPRGRVPESRHRPAPVLLVRERRPLLPGHALAPLDQSRAATAGRDPLLELLQTNGCVGGHERSRYRR
jgi:hypothetical protein